jgi:SRSO17 transposase
VFLAFRSSEGTAFIDRALYLPKVWTNDQPRRREAEIPEKTAFATKPELARVMIRRAVAAGVPARWATADEVYGSDHRFRRPLEAEGLDYVVAVTSAQRIWVDLKQVRVDALAADLHAHAWKRLSCGAGTKGERIYDWAFVAFPFQSDGHRHKGVLMRRSIDESRGHAYYLCGFKPGTALEELIRVAGCRWAIESGFEQAKQEVGLDDCEVRSWNRWHRHFTLSPFAHALLEALRVAAAAPPQKSAKRPPSGFR